jgi:hypothetical protein
MNITESSRDYRPGSRSFPDRTVPMPPPVIPKQRISKFTWLMMGFAALVLVGIIASFARVANEPQPVLDVPEGETAPGAAPR